MSYLTRLHKQTITYWANPVPDGYGGNTFDAPTAIIGRWEDKMELFTDEKGEEKRSTAVVFLGQDVVEGEYLYLGTSTETSPIDQVGARKVQAFRKIPNYNASDFERKAWL